MEPTACRNVVEYILSGERVLILYDLFLGSFLTAVFCYFLNYAMKPNEILGFYRLWLSRRILDANIPHWRDKLTPAEDNTEGLEELTEENKADIAANKKLRKNKFNELIVEVAGDFAFIEKPLGMCMVCMNIYWAWATIWLTHLPNLVCIHWYNLWVFIAYPALSNYFFRKIES